MSEQAAPPPARRFLGMNRVVLVVALAVAAAAIAGGAFALRQRDASRQNASFVGRCSEGCQTSGATPDACAALCGCMVERLRGTGAVVDLEQYYESRARGVPPDPVLQQRVNTAQTECLSAASAAR